MGATLIVEPISAADCLSRCAMTATCVAADLVNRCTPPQCWLHYRPENILRRYRGINITQYEVVTRCATIAPPTTGTGAAYTISSVLQIPVLDNTCSFTKYSILHISKLFK